tara:strand:- start:204 stop:815 length:612 start_codon:yes stop_codon:yes gene_type:complete
MPITIAGYNAYKTYIALKTHFTTDYYDYFEQKGKIKANEQSFLKRKDKFFFEKLENKYKEDLVDFFVSNMVTDQSAWVGSMVGDKAERVFNDWKKRRQSLKYSFREDMVSIRDYMDKNDITFDNIFTCVDDQHPIILKLLIAEEISIESFIILDRVLNFIRHINHFLLDEYIWLEYNKKVKKYSPFVVTDRKEYLTVMKNVFV